VVSFPVEGAGQLGDDQEITSSGQTPYGFTFAGNQTLVVTGGRGPVVSGFAVDGGEATELPSSRRPYRPETGHGLPQSPRVPTINEHFRLTHRRRHG
jgi:hypothetical protein